MKWKSRLNNCHRGRTREIRKFLIIPLCLNKEWRWLEVVTIKQEMRMKYYIFMGEYSPKGYRWTNSSFLDH